jgi:hypothetical protein
MIFSIIIIIIGGILYMMNSDSDVDDGVGPTNKSGRVGQDLQAIGGILTILFFFVLIGILTILFFFVLIGVSICLCRINVDKGIFVRQISCMEDNPPLLDNDLDC